VLQRSVLVRCELRVDLSLLVRGEIFFSDFCHRLLELLEEACGGRSFSIRTIETDEKTKSSPSGASNSASPHSVEITDDSAFLLPSCSSIGSLDPT
jgi:hypothetical protein